MTGQAVVAALAMTVAVASYPLATQRFSSNTLGVRVDVLVTENGRPLGGLTAADFVLRDNGIAQRVSVIDATDVPVNALLALDTSASIVGRRRSDLIAAGEALIDGLKPIDRVGLTAFNHAVTPAAPLTSDFSSARTALRNIHPRGRPAAKNPDRTPGGPPGSVPPDGRPALPRLRPGWPPGSGPP